MSASSSSTPIYRCAQCSADLNLSAGHLFPPSAYFEAGNKSTLSFSWVDDSKFRFTKEDKIRPFFETINYWGIQRSRVKMQCDACRALVGYVYDDGPPMMEGIGQFGMGPSQVIPRCPRFRFKISKIRVADCWARNKYLKPGALCRPRYSRATTRSCMDIGKKRVLVLDAEVEKIDLFNNEEVVLHSTTAVATPRRIEFHTMGSLGIGNERQMIPTMPKTPEAVGSRSKLESLPMDLLVKIMCHLHHDQLRAVFHVSQCIRTAVLKARQVYFNYTTPSRSRLEMLISQTPLPTEHWPFISNKDGKAIMISTPRTPKAPKHGPRPPRLHLMDIKQSAVALFQEFAVSSKFPIPPCLPRASVKPVVSNRVLFCEDELCQAVVQNKLR